VVPPGSLNTNQGWVLPVGIPSELVGHKVQAAQAVLLSNRNAKTNKR
jgi:hypothetical protein